MNFGGATEMPTSFCRQCGVRLAAEDSETEALATPQKLAKCHETHANPINVCRHNILYIISLFLPSS